MKFLNAVFKINIKDYGDKLFWIYPEGQLISDVMVESVFPKVINNYFGPALAYNCIRLTNELFFLSTVSVWNCTDEFGRRRLSLFHGCIVKIELHDTDIVSLCSCFIRIIQSHKNNYKRLNWLLDYISKNVNKNQINEIFSIFSYYQSNKFDKIVSSWINIFLISLQKDPLTNQNEKLRIFCKFPYPDDLGLCFLLCMQVVFPHIKSVGGGYLNSYEEYEHIVANEEIEGFTDFNINLLLENNSKEKNVSSNPLKMKSRIVNKYVIISFIMILIGVNIGWFFYYYIENINKSNINFKKSDLEMMSLNNNYLINSIRCMEDEQKKMKNQIDYLVKENNVKSNKIEDLENSNKKLQLKENNYVKEISTFKREIMKFKLKDTLH